MRTVGMPRYMPLEHFNQRTRFGRGRNRREGRSRRSKIDSLVHRRGSFQGLRQIVDSLSLANGLCGQPHAERALNTQD